MGQLLDVPYNIEYGAVTTDQSSLNLVYLLGFQPTPGNFSIFGLSDERYHLVGGNERLPKAVAAALPPVQLNTALTGIVQNGDGTYLLTFKNPTTIFTSTVDRVVMAIPFSVLRTILSGSGAYIAAGFDNLKKTAITQLGYGQNCKLQLQFNSRFWNQSGPWGIGNGATYSDTGYQNTWDVTRAQDGSTGILVDYTGGGVPLASLGGDPTDPMVVARFGRTFLRQIGPLFPGVTKEWNGKATLDVPLTNPFLLGSYTQFSGYEKARRLHGRWRIGGFPSRERDHSGLQEGNLPVKSYVKAPAVGLYSGGIRRGRASQPMTADAATPGMKARRASPLASHSAPAMRGTTNAVEYWTVNTAALMRCTSPAAASLGGRVRVTMKASAVAKPRTKAQPTTHGPGVTTIPI